MDIQLGAKAAGAVAVTVSLLVIVAHVWGRIVHPGTAIFEEDDTLILVLFYLIVIIFVFASFA